MRVGKKIYSYIWTNAESGSGPVNYIIMWKPYDFLILAVMSWFHRRMRPFWIKHMEYFRWCGKHECFFFSFTIIRSFFVHFKLLESKLFIKTTMSIHRRKSEKTSMRLSYRGQDLARSSTREGVMLTVLVRVHIYEETLWKQSISSHHVLGSLDNLLQEKKILQIKFST